MSLDTTAARYSTLLQIAGSLGFGGAAAAAAAAAAQGRPLPSAPGTPRTPASLHAAAYAYRGPHSSMRRTRSTATTPVAAMVDADSPGLLIAPLYRPLRPLLAPALPPPPPPPPANANPRSFAAMQGDAAIFAASEAASAPEAILDLLPPPPPPPEVGASTHSTSPLLAKHSSSNVIINGGSVRLISPDTLIADATAARYTAEAEVVKLRVALAALETRLNQTEAGGQESSTSTLVHAAHGVAATRPSASLRDALLQCVVVRPKSEGLLSAGAVTAKRVVREWAPLGPEPSAQLHAADGASPTPIAADEAHYFADVAAAATAVASAADADGFSAWVPLAAFAASANELTAAERMLSAYQEDNQRLLAAAAAAGKAAASPPAIVATVHPLPGAPAFSAFTEQPVVTSTPASIEAASAPPPALLAELERLRSDLAFARDEASADMSRMREDARAREAELGMELDRARRGRAEAEARAGGIDLQRLPRENEEAARLRADLAEARSSHESALAAVNDKLVWYRENQALIDGDKAALAARDEAVRDLTERLNSAHAQIATLTTRTRLTRGTAAAEAAEAVPPRAGSPGPPTPASAAVDEVGVENTPPLFVADAVALTSPAKGGVRPLTALTSPAGGSPPASSTKNGRRIPVPSPSTTRTPGAKGSPTKATGIPPPGLPLPATVATLRDTELAALHRRVKDLEGSLSAAEEALAKRHPDSLANLIREAKGACGAVGEPAALLAEMAQLKQSTIDVEASHDRALRALRQEYERARQGWVRREERVREETAVLRARLNALGDDAADVALIFSGCGDGGLSGSSGGGEGAEVSGEHKAAMASIAAVSKRELALRARVKELDMELERVRSFYSKRVKGSGEVGAELSGGGGRTGVPLVGGKGTAAAAAAVPPSSKRVLVSVKQRLALQQQQAKAGSGASVRVTRGASPDATAMESHPTSSLEEGGGGVVCDSRRGSVSSTSRMDAAAAPTAVSQQDEHGVTAQGDDGTVASPTVHPEQQPELVALLSQVARLEAEGEALRRRLAETQAPLLPVVVDVEVAVPATTHHASDLEAAVASLAATAPPPLQPPTASPGAIALVTGAIPLPTPLADAAAAAAAASAAAATPSPLIASVLGPHVLDATAAAAAAPWASAARVRQEELCRTIDSLYGAIALLEARAEVRETELARAEYTAHAMLSAKERIMRAQYEGALSEQARDLRVARERALALEAALADLQGGLVVSGTRPRGEPLGAF